MYDYPSNLDYSLQQIPYACSDPGYEYTNSSDCLRKVRVSSSQQAKQASRPVPVQLSVLPVPDLNDADALISEPCFSDNAIFDPDPRFQLFTQGSDYDKLSGSYINEPLGSFYPNELNGELSHTLSEAWRFNPFALSNSNARETAPHFARIPGHGLTREVASWMSSFGLSRLQARIRDKKADDVAAKEWSTWERYTELDDKDPSVLNDAATLQQELDDFYNSPMEGADPNNPYDHGYYYNASGAPHSTSVGPLGVDDLGLVNRLTGPGLGIKSTRISLPARRGWVGGMPTPVTTTGSSEYSGPREGHGYAASSLPTPDPGPVFTTADANERPPVDQAPSLISPPLTGVSFAPASHNRYGFMIPRDHSPPGKIQSTSGYTPANTTFLVNQVCHQDHAFAAPEGEPTFKAKVAPLRRPKQTGRSLALFGSNGECEWKGRQEGPYDFSDFCSENSDISDASERTAGSGGISGFSPTNTTVPKLDGVNGNIFMPDVNDANDGILQGTATSVAVTNNLSIKSVGSEALFGNYNAHFPIKTLEDAHPEDISSGNFAEQTTPVAGVDVFGQIWTPKGSPAQAKILAQDLEQNSHSAVSQTAFLARNISQASPLSLPQPLIAIPKPHGPPKDGDCLTSLAEPNDEQMCTQIVEAASEQDHNNNSHTNPFTGAMQTEYIHHEPHRSPGNTFNTPVTRCIQNIQSASLTKPTVINHVPGYNGDNEDDVRASRNKLFAGVSSSSANGSESGRTALTNHVQDFSSTPSLAPHNSIAAGVNDADPPTNDPEDMALTPTHEAFDPDNLTPIDPLEAVSLVEESTNTTTTTETPNSTPSAVFNAFQHSHTPNMAPTRSPYAKACSPTSSTYHTPPTAAPALTTPINHTPLMSNPHTPFKVSTASRTPTLTLPLTAPGTPTPAPKASSQHRSKKPSGPILKHADPRMEAALQQKSSKSVKNVFKSKALGSRTPSPGKEAASQDSFVMESGQGSIEAAGKRATKATPTHAAPVAIMTANAPSQGKAIVGNAQPAVGTTNMKSQDPTAQAIVVKNKRKQKPSSREGQKQKKPRRSSRTTEHEAAKTPNGALLS